MNWERNTASGGAPVWTGVDTIFDPWWDRRTSSHFYDNIFAGVMIGILFIGISLCLESAMLYSPWGGQGWRKTYYASILYLFAAPTCGILAWRIYTKRDWKLPSRLFERRWKLQADGDHLVYAAGPFSLGLDPFEVSRAGRSWRLSVDEIARVESSLTTDWQPGRAYSTRPWHAEKLQPISQFEFQTFLYLNDGTRRVIFTSNANREGCGALFARPGVLARRAKNDAPVDRNRLKLERHAVAVAVKPARADAVPEGFLAFGEDMIRDEVGKFGLCGLSLLRTCHEKISFGWGWL